MKIKYFFILLVLLLYLGLQIFMPVLVANQIEKGITAKVENVQGLEVNVSTFPVWDFLSSRADHLELKADQLSSNDLTLNSVLARYNNVSWREGKFTGENTDLRLVISQQALNKFVHGKYGGLQNFDIVFNPEQVYITGYLLIFDTKINVQMTGQFQIAENNKIVFEPGNVQIEKLNIPASVVESFKKSLDFSIDLNQLGIPLNLEEVKIRAGELDLLGGIYVRKAGQ